MNYAEAIELTQKVSKTLKLSSRGIAITVEHDCFFVWTINDNVIESRKWPVQNENFESLVCKIQDICWSSEVNKRFPVY